MEVKVEIKVVSFGELNEANMVRDCSFSFTSSHNLNLANDDRKATMLIIVQS